MAVNKLVLRGGQTTGWTESQEALFLPWCLGSPHNKMTTLVAVLYDWSHRLESPQVTGSYCWPRIQPTESTGVPVPQAAEVKSSLLAPSSIVNCKFIPPLCRKRIQTSYICREDVGLYNTK